MDHVAIDLGGKRSQICVRRADGTVLARFPVLDRDIRHGRTGLIEKLIAANPEAGLITVTAPADGIERRLGYRRLAEYPIYVSAGLETSTIRARWLATMSQHLIFGAPATALLFALLGLALRRTRHLHFEAEKRQARADAVRGGLGQVGSADGMFPEQEEPEYPAPPEEEPPPAPAPNCPPEGC